MINNQTIINNITPQDFKDYFTREFNYLSLWYSDISYKINDIVYYESEGLFYKSLINNNINNTPSEDSEYWQEDDEVQYNDYINDNDITKAFSQAKNMINLSLFGKNEELLKMCYLMLTAHFLVMDLNMSNGNGASSFMITSKSVGSVSASYGIPQKILDNPNLSYLASTQFGLKYIQYILPLLSGNIMILNGRTSLL